MSSDLQLAEQRLVDEWIVPTLGDTATATFGTGAEPIAPERLNVVLRLLSLAPLPPARGRDSPALQLLARYIVSVSGEEPAARYALTDLAFSVMATPPLELEPPPHSWGAWSPSEAPLAVIVRVPVPRAPPRRRIPLVTHVLESRWTTLRPLHGRLVAGPEDTPVAGALIELRGLNAATYSERDGSFRFPSVAGGARGTTLDVRARGLTLSFDAPPPDAGGDPLIVRLPLPEA
jgi:hypothetical protein